ncbi:MarR family transcriptional regulator [Ancylobacter sp. 6x-1]|uniref:MarR family transcriptional regulator n=1 Tax=Ancylobacter crimeensis TaxID=2579147 RepID=A0ABT0DCK0_9HYPH|nr:MarR family transcriptional regulator [Ancylobacter crimeensis]MCK0197686.1 MarR family transcriptional regulator [Ancylobacter crimeensis]
MNDTTHLRTEFTAALIQASRQWRRTVERELEEFGVSEACAAPLIWIARLGGGVRQVTLASYVGIEGPSMVRLLDQLGAAGLIERRDDPTDRRAKTVWLTEEGEHLAARIEVLLVGVRSRVLADVSRDDILTAMRVLRAFEDAPQRSLQVDEAAS